MLSPKILDDLASKLADSMPKGVQALQEDVEKNFRAVLQNQFSKLNLVTREEFEAQKKVLLQTRQKITDLEKIVADLENAKKTDN